MNPSKTTGAARALQEKYPPSLFVIKASSIYLLPVLGLRPSTTTSEEEQEDKRISDGIRGVALQRSLPFDNSQHIRDPRRPCASPLDLICSPARDINRILLPRWDYFRRRRRESGVALHRPYESFKASGLSQKFASSELSSSLSTGTSVCSEK